MDQELVKLSDFIKNQEKEEQELQLDEEQELQLEKEEKIKEQEFLLKRRVERYFKFVDMKIPDLILNINLLSIIEACKKIQELRDKIVEPYSDNLE